MSLSGHAVDLECLQVPLKQKQYFLPGSFHFSVYGEDIERIRISRNQKNTKATVAYQNGMIATLIFINKYYGWNTFIERDEGLVELKPRVEETDPPENYVEKVEILKQEKNPEVIRAFSIAYQYWKLWSVQWKIKIERLLISIQFKNRIFTYLF